MRLQAPPGYGASHLLCHAGDLTCKVLRPVGNTNDIPRPHETLPRRQTVSLGVTMANRASGCHHEAAADAMLKQAHHDALSKFATQPYTNAGFSRGAYQVRIIAGMIHMVNQASTFIE